MGFGVRGEFQYSYKAGNYMEKDKYQQYLFGITPVGSPISSFNKYFLAFFNINAP
uniref:hypothetical protein n=1 Tax=Helicobacter pylori TaxID=210 RepID=UPI001F528508|nr:hypothetical protein [Helicobacter pylori]